MCEGAGFYSVRDRVWGVKKEINTKGKRRYRGFLT